LVALSKGKVYLLVENPSDSMQCHNYRRQQVNSFITAGG
jgi:hypothetical protein